MTKQGTASSSRMGATKTEPRSQAVNVKAVAEIGVHEVGVKENLYEGRGLKAPMVGESTHKCGSQGKY